MLVASVKRRCVLVSKREGADKKRKKRREGGSCQVDSSSDNGVTRPTRLVEWILSS